MIRAGWIRSSLLSPVILQPLLVSVIITLWLWLYWPVLKYLGVIFTHQDFGVNQAALALVVLLLAIRLPVWSRVEWRGRFQRPWPALVMRSNRLALGIVFGGSLVYLLVGRIYEINSLSAALFALSTYGLLGLWLPEAIWRAGRLPALLLALTLPFGDHLQTFVGYPARLLTAAIVRDGLAAAGLAVRSTETILAFESQVMAASALQVDLPCSGVKSLWAGLLFLLAVTWIDRRPLNLRWVLVAAGFTGLLFVANTLRVAALVLVGQVAGPYVLATPETASLAAQMLHLPLGVLGFGAACAAAVWGLSVSVPAEEKGTLAREMNAGDAGINSSPPTTLTGSKVQLSPAVWSADRLWLLLALGLLVIGGAAQLLDGSRAAKASSAPTAKWNFPAEMQVTAFPLTDQEKGWLAQAGVESAERVRFDWQGFRGQALLVTASTWRAQHRPERCFQVFGLTADHTRTILAAPDFALRLVSLGDGKDHGMLSAAYWFQSSVWTTDDYAARIWADLSGGRQRWVLVTILFDEAYSGDEPELQSLYRALRQAVAGSPAWR